MFERYSEESRRVIFFARYEASEFGSPLIETEHMLLGILRETKRVLAMLSPDASEQFRNVVAREKGKGRHIPISDDLPLSSASKRILAYGCEEAERLTHSRIEPEHLLLGLLRDSDSIATRFLQEHGISAETIRNSMALPQSIEALRSAFAPLMKRLTPEIEPATVFFVE